MPFNCESIIDSNQFRNDNRLTMATRISFRHRKTILQHVMLLFNDLCIRVNNSENASGNGEFPVSITGCIKTRGIGIVQMSLYYIMAIIKFYKVNTSSDAK